MRWLILAFVLALAPQPIPPDGITPTDHGCIGVESTDPVYGNVRLEFSPAVQPGWVVVASRPLPIAAWDVGTPDTPPSFPVGPFTAAVVPVGVSSVAAQGPSPFWLYACPSAGHVPPGVGSRVILPLVQA